MAKSTCRWDCPEDWSEWSEWLAAALHARNRWRLPVLLLGMLFAGGRRTVTTWLRAAGVSGDFQAYYYSLAALGRKTESIATQLIALLLRTLPLPKRLLAVLDDSPAKRYGPKVEGADVHHNPTPGPADQPFLYGQAVDATDRSPRRAELQEVCRTSAVFAQSRTSEVSATWCSCDLPADGWS